MNGKYMLMLCLYLGYMMHTYSRRSFQNVINYLLKEKVMDINAIGLIVTCQQTGYTLIKFVLPFILDDIDPKLFFAATMIGSFYFVGMFSYSSTIPTFCIIYFLQGLVLGLSWPTLIKILKRITKKYELGTWWSIQCTSSNVATISGAVVTTLIANKYGWRNSMRVCAYVNLGVGVLIILAFLLLDMPGSGPRESRSFMEVIDEYSISFWSVMVDPILFFNGWYYFALHMCRYIIADWYQIYLLELKFTQIAISGFVSSMELGGAIGSICAGFASDYFIVKLVSYKNPRLFILIICGLFASLIQHNMIFLVSENTSGYTLDLLGFTYGLFLFGPVAVSGVIAMEAVPTKSQGLSFSINSIYANVAMMCTGYPMSLLASFITWKWVIVSSYIFLLVMTICIIFVRYKSTPLESCISEENKLLAQKPEPMFLFPVYSTDNHLSS